MRRTKTSGDHINMQMSLLSILKKLILITLIPFFIGYFSYHNTALLNIGAYGSLILSIIVLITDTNQRKFAKNTVFMNVRRNIFLYGFFMVYLLYLVFSALFLSYDNLYHLPLDAIYKDIRYPIILFIAVLAVQSALTAKHLLTILLTTFCIIILIIPIQGYFYPQPNQNFALFMRYGYMFPIVLLFPFLLASTLLYKNKVYFLVVTFLSIITYVIVIAAGARGSFLAISVELFLFLCLLSYFKKITLKKLFLIICSIAILVAIIVGVMYKNSNLVEGKVWQSLGNQDFTGGRMTLIETRFPIFMKDGSIIHGIGYGNKIYQQFLEDHKAPKVVGIWGVENGQPHFSYYRDEPQLLSSFYESGVVGLILFSLFVLTFLITSLRAFSLQNHAKIIAIAIFLNIVGNTLVLGVVEHTSVPNLLFFAVILALVNTKLLPNQRRHDDESN